MVRLAGTDTDTTLIDANPDSEGVDNKKRFHDSFLNEGKTLDIGAPLNI